MALDLADGSLKGKTFMTPPGYTGAAVWGSSPSVDTKRRTVYISTGNNYSIPDSATACVDGATTDGSVQPASPPTTCSTPSWRSTWTPGP